VVLREQADDLWVEGFFTVGVTNAVRVGESIDSTPSANPQKPGTINVVLITNAALTVSAMVTAVQVATESKAAVLLANRIPSWTGRSEATGTGTDVVVVVNGNGPLIRYSGTHTKIGELIGRLVSHGIESGLIKARLRKRSR
jgi:iron complex transport system ATP-binding protein